jgi:transcription initiation factor TFIID subunit 6
MTTEDIDQAFRVLNIEPLYGHSPHNPPTFRRAIPYPPNSSTGTLYFVEDEEIDFDRVLREEKITLPKPVSWTAHWLAVEGVQPLIPENPPAITKDTEEPSALKSITGQPSTSALGTQSTVKGRQQNQQLVKQVLSRELQLYYARLTSSLLPPAPEDYVKRTAALASLRHDAGLQALLPYIVRWVVEGVVNTLRAGSQTETDGRVLEVLLDVISALLDNSTLFVEPYVKRIFCPFSESWLMYFLSVTPDAASRLVHSAAFILTVDPLDPPTHLSSTIDVTPPDTTFHNVSFFGSSHHEDLASGASFDRQESRHPRRCYPGSCGCW